MADIIMSATRGRTCQVLKCLQALEKLWEFFSCFHKCPCIRQEKRPGSPEREGNKGSASVLDKSGSRLSSSSLSVNSVVGLP